MAEPNGNGYTNNFAQRYSAIIQTITVVALFVGGFWAAVISPLSTRFDRMDQETIKVREYSFSEKKFDERINLLISGQERLRTEVLTKAQFEAQQSADKQHFERMQSDLKDLRDFIGGTYSIKDALAQQQKQLDALTAKVHQ